MVIQGDHDSEYKDFNLSDKIHTGKTPMGNDYYWINDGDVKEFIQRLKSKKYRVATFNKEGTKWEKYPCMIDYEDLDKIFGDKLTWIEEISYLIAWLDTWLLFVGMFMIEKTILNGGRVNLENET